MILRMKLVIDEDVLAKHNMPFPRFLLMLSMKIGANLSTEFKNLVDEKAILRQPDGTPFLSMPAEEEVERILFESDDSLPKESEVEKLAIKLMAIMPQTKMPGTPYYYKCNKKEVTNKLMKFYKLYGRYKDEDIIDATTKYVKGFNGDYTYMKLLKYFIIKDDTSMLATMLENKEDNPENTDWTVRFV